MSPSGDTVDSAFRRKRLLISSKKYIPPASNQENCSISFDHGGDAVFQKQETGRAALQPRLLYVVHSGFCAQNLQIRLSCRCKRAGTGKCTGAIPQNRFTGKRRRAKITILPCSFRVFSLAAPSLAIFESWVRRKSAKPGLEG